MNLTDEQKIRAVEKKLDRYVKPVNVKLERIVGKSIVFVINVTLLWLDLAFMYYGLWLNKISIFGHHLFEHAMRDDIHALWKFIHG